jgi:hypothetical protein
MVGLALLVGTGQPEDVPAIRTIGLLRFLGPLAVTALASIPGTSPDLVWLAERSARYPRVSAVEALCQRADPVAVTWLLRHAVNSDGLPAALAREVAQTVSLADVLHAGDIDSDVLDQAARLLLAMVAPNEYRAQLSLYADARRAYDALARQVHRARPSLERFVVLASLIEDLHTGHAACLAWEPGQLDDIVDLLREVLLHSDWVEALSSALQSPDPGIRRRAQWAAATGRPAALTTLSAPRAHNRFDIRVVVPDPARKQDVETRILVDGRPVVAAAFDKGTAYAPEYLLTEQRLHATD